MAQLLPSHTALSPNSPDLSPRLCGPSPGLENKDWGRSRMLPDSRTNICCVCSITGWLWVTCAVGTLSDIRESHWSAHHCRSDHRRRPETEGRLWFKARLPWHWLGRFESVWHLHSSREHQTLLSYTAVCVTARLHVELLVLPDVLSYFCT